MLLIAGPGAATGSAPRVDLYAKAKLLNDGKTSSQGRAVMVIRARNAYKDAVRKFRESERLYTSGTQEKDQSAESCMVLEGKYKS